MDGGELQAIVDLNVRANRPSPHWETCVRAVCVYVCVSAPSQYHLAAQERCWRISA